MSTNPNMSVPTALSDAPLRAISFGNPGFVMNLLTPGLVFADNAGRFADALAANVPEKVEIVASQGTVPGREVTMLSELQATPEHSGLDAAHDRIGPDTIAKFLLTSG